MPTKAYWLGQGLGRLPGGDRGLSWAAGQRDRALAPIFMLHRVLPAGSPCYDPEMAVSVAAMRRFCAWLAAEYEVVPLPELLPRLDAAPARPLCALTFDDGWLDTFTHAFPLLQEYGLPATVFLPLMFIGGHRRFWQERLFYYLRQMQTGGVGIEPLRRIAATLPWCPDLGPRDLNFGSLRRRLLRRASAEAEEFVDRLGEVVPAPVELTGRAFLNWDEVAAMKRGGMQFGSHTLHHTLLQSSSPSQAEHILCESRTALSEQLGAEVEAVSYPWGRAGYFGPTLAQSAGYSLGVTTASALCGGGSHPWRLPRIAVSESALQAWSPAAPSRPRSLLVQIARTRRRPDRRVRVAAKNERLRIGFLLDSPEIWTRPDLYLGGSEIQVRYILEALDPDFFEVELYFLHQPPPPGPETPWPCFAAAAAGSGRVAVMAGVRRLLRQRRPALVQAMFQDTLFFGVPAAWSAGVPAILCARRNMGHWKRWYHRLGLRAVNRMATGWQTNGRAIAEMLERAEGVAAERIEILPNRMDLERFRPSAPEQRAAARRRLGLDRAGLVLAVVASYTPVKNHATLMQAAATVVAACPGGYFLLIGEGPERGHLEGQIAAAGLQDSVRLTGSVRNVEEYLAAADIGILSSWNEGCSNAVLEYMAAGLPVLASDIPSNRSLLGDEALVPAGDAAAWARAILALARDPGAREELGSANRRRAEGYGAGAFAERVQAHYLRMTALGRRQHHQTKIVSPWSRLRRDCPWIG